MKEYQRKRKTERNWRVDKKTGGSYTRTYNCDINFTGQTSKLRWYNFSLRYMSFTLCFLYSLLLKNISVGCLEDYHERGKSKYILRKFETSAR